MRKGITKIRISITMDKDLLKEVDELKWAYSQKFLASRSEMIEILTEIGLRFLRKQECKIPVFKVDK